jgi:uncharacterized protein (TIGR03118 family)
MKRSRWIAPTVTALAIALVTAGNAAGASRHHPGDAYTVTPLVSDQVGMAPTVDPNLVNAWGISAGPTTPWWVANNGTDTSTLYDAAGMPLPPPPNGPLVVAVPRAPTGTVFYGGTKLLVSNGTAMVPAKFIFATEAGTIQGWPPGTAATVTGADGSAWGAVYKGLATAGDWLYAADFHNGRVDIFDGDWKPVKLPGAFSDPGLPKGYAPFGIQTLGGNIFVTYAKQGEDDDEAAGPGLGFVDEYSPMGELIARVASRGALNAPWGLAWAPATGFGKASGQLLVGNFGDGRINVFRQDKHGRWKKSGRLLTADHKPLEVDGLWGIGFGNGAVAGPTTTLYFAAGPDDESHGLYGAITATP